MPESPLKSLADYSRFVAELFDQPKVERSTVTLWSDSPYPAPGISFDHPNLPLLLREIENLCARDSK